MSYGSMDWWWRCWHGGWQHDPAVLARGIGIMYPLPHTWSVCWAMVAEKTAVAQDPGCGYLAVSSFSVQGSTEL